MEKLTLGIIVAALLVVSAVGLVAMSYNADDSDNNNNNGDKLVRVSAAELMPDIEEFPEGEGWLIDGTLYGPFSLDGALAFQLSYFNGTNSLIVQIAVCATVADAENAFDARKVIGSAFPAPLTEYEDRFEQWSAYKPVTYDTTFFFQHANVYGTLTEMDNVLSDDEWDKILADIAGKILAALA